MPCALSYHWRVIVDERSSYSWIVYCFSLLHDRCTIKSKKLSDKGLSESRRDLVTYRKMSVKMDQRQQRPLKNRPMVSFIAYFISKIL